MNNPAEGTTPIDFERLKRGVMSFQELEAVARELAALKARNAELEAKLSEYREHTNELGFDFNEVRMERDQAIRERDDSRSAAHHSIKLARENALEEAAQKLHKARSTLLIQESLYARGLFNAEGIVRALISQPANEKKA